jgi:hypothetical protein
MEKFGLYYNYGLQVTFPEKYDLVKKSLKIPKG